MRKPNWHLVSNVSNTGMKVDIRERKQNIAQSIRQGDRNA